MMGSPWPVLAIVVIYLIFVIRLGPQMMRNRKPVSIKPIMLIYNLYQTISNAYLVSLVSISAIILYFCFHLLLQ